MALATRNLPLRSARRFLRVGFLLPLVDHVARAILELTPGRPSWATAVLTAVQFAAVVYVLGADPIGGSKNPPQPMPPGGSDAPRPPGAERAPGP